MRELLALLFLGRKVQSEILRCALQKLDELLVSVEQFRPGGLEGVLAAFCPPERPQHCDS